MTPVQFVPKREVWFVSAFIDASAVDPYAKAAELADAIEARLRSLTASDFPRLSWNPKLVAQAVAMTGSATVRGTWSPYIDGFPYNDENTGLHYNKLGYFELEVEYFAKEPDQRAQLDPILVQQPPIVAAEVLRARAALKANSAVRMDTTSPIFVFVVTDEVRPEAPPWTRENISLHKRAIGSWTDVYSGAWPDYTEELYDRRVEGNLSNRLSELHIIRKNSGLLYLAPDNMRRFFDSYMRPFVVAPTAQLRSMHFAMFSINESIDILSMRQAQEDFLDLEVIETKLKNLRQIRIALQMKMSEIYNELDSNKRQHYSAVLQHLLQEFNLTKTGIFARISEKFETLHNGLQQLYQRKEAENQARTERRLNTLNTLFSLGVFADFAALLLGTVESVREGSVFSGIVNGSFSAILFVVLVLALAGRIRLRFETRAEARPQLAADAILLDDKGRVLVIKRRSPPCRGQRGFPGTLLAHGEDAVAALQRAVKSETNLDVLIDRKVGRYDAAGRDPRGRVISEAFLCRLAPGAQQLRCREESGEAQFVPLEELRDEDLAFDHEDMLADAVRLGIVAPA